MDEFLGSHYFLLAEVVPKHKSVHGSVEFDFVVGLTVEFVFSSEDFNYLFRQILVDIFSQVVLVDMFAHFQVQFDVLNVTQFLLIFSHTAANQPMFVQFLLNSVL